MVKKKKKSEVVQVPLIRLPEAFVLFWNNPALGFLTGTKGAIQTPPHQNRCEWKLSSLGVITTNLLRTFHCEHLLINTTVSQVLRL